MGHLADPAASHALMNACLTLGIHPYLFIAVIPHFFLQGAQGSMCGPPPSHIIPTIPL